MAAGQAQGHLACHRWDPLDLKSDASFFFCGARICVCVRACVRLAFSSHSLPGLPTSSVHVFIGRSVLLLFIPSPVPSLPAPSPSLCLSPPPQLNVGHGAPCTRLLPISAPTHRWPPETHCAHTHTQTHTSCSFNILIPSHFLFHPPSTSRGPAPDYLCLRRVCTLPPPTSSPVSRDADGIQMSFNYLCNRHSLKGS